MDRLIGYSKRAWRAIKRFFSSSLGSQWRTRVIRSTGFAFPIPVNSRSRKRRVFVNKLGLRFLKRREFPQWVAWDYKDPDYLYVNTNMLSRILIHNLKLPHTDSMVWIMADTIGKAWLREVHKVDKIKSLKTNKEIDTFCDLTSWLTILNKSDIGDF